MEEINNIVKVDSKLNIDHLTLRKYIGILGITLPVILILGNKGVVEPSISDYYYTNMTVVFTSVLFAFGLVLLAYKGSQLDENEIISDNLITNIAGILAIVVAVIPTEGEVGFEGVPNWHTSKFLTSIHLISAGLFILLMGYMSFVQFSKEKRKIVENALLPVSSEYKSIKRRIFVYKFCGIMVWLAVAFLIAKEITGFSITTADTFWGEAVALLFFGIAWLTKSKSLKRWSL